MIRLEDLFATVYSLGKPIISRISGPAIAGGCMIATATDYRIITPAAKIGILESRIGVPLPMTAIEILRDVCSTAAFRRIISTGSTYTGTAAVAAGLADEVAVDELLDASCNRAARQFADLPPAAFQMTKRQRIEPVIRRIRNNHQLLFDDYMQIWESGTTREAIRRYVEQRLQ
jgi:enoyl-CoA hydratase/carnithine racemase